MLAAPPLVAVAAEVDEMTRLTKPQSTVSGGVGYLSSDAPLSGQYTGRDEEGFYFLGDIDVVRRYDETGTWIEFRGRDLGLDSRELRFEHERQGNWGYSIEYDALPRIEPYRITTTTTGIGQTTQTVGGTALRSVKLETKREKLTFEFKKYLPANFDFRVKFRNEERNGERLFGERGAAFNFLTEPVDSTTNQVDAVLSYTGKKLQLAGGYYGSFYDQHKPKIDNPAGRFTTISQPPGSQSHQFHLTGGYSFTPTTRGTVKVKYAHTTQEETFVEPPSNTANLRRNADAAMDVFSGHLGVTSRPTSKLSLLGNVNFETRDERTPVDTYISGVGGGSRHDGKNIPHSRKTARGKVEASYRLPMGFRATGGVEHMVRTRTVPNVRAVTYRTRTDETSYRVELQRSMSETLNGRVSYTHSERGGSDYRTNLVNSGAIGSNLINPLHFADRDRDKVKLMLDWVPTDELSFQLMAWYSMDHYDTSPDADPSTPDSAPNPFGPKNGNARAIALDAAYLLNDAWTVTGWYANEHTEAESTTQCLRVTVPNCPDPVGVVRTTDLENTSHAFGLGLQGSFENGIKAGADFSFSFDRGKFRQTVAPGATPYADIDNVYYRNVRLNLFAEYDVRPNVGFRFDYVHDRWSRDDWQWEGFLYGDGGSVFMQPKQVSNFFGVSMYYKYW